MYVRFGIVILSNVSFGIIFPISRYFPEFIPDLKYSSIKCRMDLLVSTKMIQIDLKCTSVCYFCLKMNLAIQDIHKLSR